MLIFLVYILGSIIAFILSLHLLYYYSKDSRWSIKYQREFFIDESPFTAGAFIFSWFGVLVCILLYLSILFNKFIEYLSNKWIDYE